MAEVSVILACHNASPFILKAIDSALAQRDVAIEVLVIDDRSQDDTCLKVETVAAADPRVRLWRTPENVGPGFARNLGLLQAQGEWIAVLDADDAFDPGRTATLLDLADTFKADIVSDNLALIDEETGGRLGVMFPKSWIDGPRLLTPVDYVRGNIGRREAARRAFGFMKPIVHRAALQRNHVRYRISRFAEDYLFGLDLLLTGCRWAITPTAYYHYAVRPGSLSVALQDRDLEALLAGEERVFSDPLVGEDSGLYRALQDHYTSVMRALQWNCFASQLKAKSLQGALRSYISDPAATRHITQELIALLGRKVRTGVAPRTIR